MSAFLSTVDRVAAALAERESVRAGDRVAILAANRPEWMIAFWAAVRLGAVAVGLNAWWKRDEILFALAHSGASVLIADSPRLTRIADDLTDLGSRLSVYAIDHGTTKPATALDFRELSTWSGNPISAPPIAEDDPAMILYTSGTTGRSKGAVSTHRSMLANLQNAQFNAALRTAYLGVGASPAQAMLLTSPMFHVSGCHSGIVVGMASSAKVVLPVGRADAHQILRLIERERVTTWPTVPTLALRVADCPDRHNFDTSSLVAVAYGGSPSAVEVQRRVEETFPSARGAIRNAYGLTESSSVAAAIEGAALTSRPTSVGLPVPVVEIRIADEAGVAQPAGQSGEIWLRGSTIMAGYWGDAEATAGALTPDRWLKTGDVGVLDEEGYLYVVDRFKDVIIRGGENIYSVEIENRLMEHETVLDAAAVGVPHPTLGEEVLAVVQLTPGSSTSVDELRDWVAVSLADFKVPAYVTRTERTLPRNASGKLMKDVLRGAKDVPLDELF